VGDRQQIQVVVFDGAQLSAEIPPVQRFANYSDMRANA
jgi:hypothetical protein